MITIIILLILAGISISALTGNGLFEKAKLAKQKSTEAEVKEKIELLLYEYQMEKVNSENLSLYEYFTQKKESGEIETLKENGDGTIKVGLKGYTVTIDVEKAAIISIETTNDIEFTYELTSYENNKFKILIKISDKSNGINTIQYPDGDIQECNGIEQVGIDYEVNEGTDYIFIAKNTNGVERREVINFTKPEKPTASDVNVGYPTLTLTGVESSKIEINYDEREEFLNYYSLDNGETWNLYIGSINANATTIKAKSVHKKCKDIFEESEITVNIPYDSLTGKAFDGDIETFDYYSFYTNNPELVAHCYFLVDESCWGNNLSVNCSCHGNGCNLRVYYFNIDGEIIYQSLIGMEDRHKKTESFEIPSGIYKIKLIAEGYERDLFVHELGINIPNTPIIKAEYDEAKMNKTALSYPILTVDGVKNCSINPEIGSKIKLEISNEEKNGIENYYSLDGGNTWNLYTNVIETTYQGEELIQAKSINKYYKRESQINILKNYVKDLNIACTASDAVGIGGYDGDEETYSNGNMSVDSGAWWRKLKLKYISNGTRTINFFNGGGGLIGCTPNGEYGIVSCYGFAPIDTISINVRWLGWRFYI